MQVEAEHLVSIIKGIQFHFKDRSDCERETRIHTKGFIPCGIQRVVEMGKTVKKLPQGMF